MLQYGNVVETDEVEPARFVLFGPRNVGKTNMLKWVDMMYPGVPVGDFSSGGHPEAVEDLLQYWVITSSKEVADPIYDGWTRVVLVEDQAIYKTKMAVVAAADQSQRMDVNSPEYDMKHWRERAGGNLCLTIPAAQRWIKRALEQQVRMRAAAKDGKFKTWDDGARTSTHVYDKMVTPYQVMRRAVETIGVPVIYKDGFLSAAYASRSQLNAARNARSSGGVSDLLDELGRLTKLTADEINAGIEDLGKRGVALTALIRSEYFVARARLGGVGSALAEDLITDSIAQTDGERERLGMRLRRNGEVLYVPTSSSPFPNESGNRTSIVGLRLTEDGVTWHDDVILLKGQITRRTKETDLLTDIEDVPMGSTGAGVPGYLGRGEAMVFVGHFVGISVSAAEFITMDEDKYLNAVATAGSHDMMMSLLGRTMLGRIDLGHKQGKWTYAYELGNVGISIVTDGDYVQFVIGLSTQDMALRPWNERVGVVTSNVRSKLSGDDELDNLSYASRCMLKAMVYILGGMFPRGNKDPKPLYMGARGVVRVPAFSSSLLRQMERRKADREYLARYDGLEPNGSMSVDEIIHWTFFHMGMYGMFPVLNLVGDATQDELPVEDPLMKRIRMEDFVKRLSGVTVAWSGDGDVKSGGLYELFVFIRRHVRAKTYKVLGRPYFTPYAMLA